MRDAGWGAHANHTQGRILHQLSAKPPGVRTVKEIQDLPLGGLQGRELQAPLSLTPSPNSSEALWCYWGRGKPGWAEGR